MPTTPTALAHLTKRLDWIGAALLAAAAAGFVWAVGFTRGVDALIDALVFAGVGLLFPGITVLWVSWIIGSAAGNDPPAEPPAESTRQRWTRRLLNYAIAALCVALAAGARELLTPYLHQHAPFPTFFLAVAISAWVGGMGPAVFAVALSVPATWALFIRPRSPFPDSAAEVVGTGLFVAVALAIAGITAALRLAQTRATRVGDELVARQAALDESEARFHDLADRSAAMIWLADADGHRTFFNHAWKAFTGPESDRLLTARWIEALHPRDGERCLTQQREAVETREAFTLHYRLRRPDGEYRSCVDTGHPRFLADGRLAGFVGECTDVTDMSQPLRALASAGTAAGDGVVR